MASGVGDRFWRWDVGRSPREACSLRLCERLFQQRVVELQPEPLIDGKHGNPVDKSKHAKQRDLPPTDLWRPGGILELNDDRRKDGQDTELVDAAGDGGHPAPVSAEPIGCIVAHRLQPLALERAQPVKEPFVAWHVRIEGARELPSLITESQLRDFGDRRA